MKKLLSLIIFLTAFNAKAEMDPSFVIFCENANKISEIGSIITPTLWPAASPLPPWGGVVIGMTSQTNVIVELCQFVLQFSEWDNQQKFFGSKQMLNTVTGGKFNEELNMVDKTFDVINTVYDFDSGEGRPGAMTNDSTLRAMNDYTRDIQEYIANKNLSASQEKKQNVSQTSDNMAFAKVAASNANLKAALNCPDPTSSPQYSDIYAKQAQLQTPRRDDAQRDMDFYKEQMIAMGQSMFQGEGTIYRYINDLERLAVAGVYQDISEDIIYEETYKASKIKDKTGKPAQLKTILKRPYQVFTAKTNDQPFTKFKEDYNEKWKSFVMWTYLQNSTQYGVFAGADERVEKTFRNLSFECSEQKIMAGYNPDKADYDAVYEKKRSQCESSIEVNEKKVNNLLDYYVGKYQSALLIQKDAESKLWTLDSKYLKITRAVTKDVGNSSFINEDVKCSETLTIAEMNALSLKMKQNHSELKEEILMNKKKSVTMEQEKAKQEADFIRSQKERDAYMIKKKNDQDNAAGVQGTISPPRGGIVGH